MRRTFASLFLLAVIRRLLSSISRLMSVWLALCILLITNCDKEEHMPRETMTGQNTFGCLVNGKLWVPKGYMGISNLDISYDRGAFDLATYRMISKSTFQAIRLFSPNLNAVGEYSLDDNSGQIVSYGVYGDGTSCDYESDLIETTCTGKLTITRLDFTVGIIAGRFEFALKTPGCPDIVVTEGRFDMPIQ